MRTAAGVCRARKLLRVVVAGVCARLEWSWWQREREFTNVHSITKAKNGIEIQNGCLRRVKTQDSRTSRAPEILKYGWCSDEGRVGEE